MVQRNLVLGLEVGRRLRSPSLAAADADPVQEESRGVSSHCRTDDPHLSELERKEQIVYARIARFEGVDPSRVDQQVASMKQQMAAARSGGLPEGAPEEVRTLMETIARFVQLVDREKGNAIGIAFCRSEDDVRRADAALNAMSPDEGEGRRVGSAEIYEVVVDEAFD